MHLLSDQVEVSVFAQGFGSPDSYFRSIGDLRSQVVPVPRRSCEDDVGLSPRFKAELNGPAGRLIDSVSFSPYFSNRVRVKPSGVMNPAFREHDVLFLGLSGPGQE